MIVFQALLLVFGIASGLFIASWLRRHLWDHSGTCKRSWHSGPARPLGLASALLASLARSCGRLSERSWHSIYLPSLIVLIASGSGSVDAKQDA